ncbi:MAG: NAD(P)H-dependent oxidoreductase subunit E [Endomicrobia bacterium]|nr:NAD(P)H-dependent oxidoreductase subunit E [Endomicrobiia bacterium]
MQNKDNIIEKNLSLNLLKDYLQTFKDKPRTESNLITILHKVQDIFGYLEQTAIEEIAKTIQIPTSHIWGVATFYHYFKLRKPGKYIISVCLGTACYIKGADEILTKLKDELKTNIGGVSPDGLFSLEEARCLGACSLAPVVMIDGKVYGNLTPQSVVQLIKEFRKKQKE